MESDQSIALTIRAAARGVIDFTQARTEDKYWWLKTRFLLRELAREEEQKALQSILALQLALVGNGSLEEESFKKVQNNAKELLLRLLNIISPWDRASPEELEKQKIEKMIETYRQVFDKRITESGS